MIKTVKGNLLEQDVQALVNTVNCVGVMGRGIALQFKNAFPENYSFYHEACKNKTVSPGKVLVFDGKIFCLIPSILSISQQNSTGERRANFRT